MAYRHDLTRRADKLRVVKKRLGTVVLLGVLVVSLTGCDPWGVPTDSSRASMSISLGSEGGASVQLILGGEKSDHSALLHTGNAFVAALFPSATRRSATINSNQGAFPFVDLHAAGVYRRGAHPLVTIDTQRALAVLAETGYRNVDVDIDAGGVASTATWVSVPGSTYRNSWSWSSIVPGDPAPAGTIQLNPHPWQGFGAVGLEAGTLAALLLA